MESDLYCTIGTRKLLYDYDSRNILFQLIGKYNHIYGSQSVGRIS